jgi:hypothetical protein
MFAALQIPAALGRLIFAVAICAPAATVFAAPTKVNLPSQGQPSWVGSQARNGANVCLVNLDRKLEADSPGTYQGYAPAADPAKRVFTLNLAADGTAVFTTLYIGKNEATQYGRWTQNGSQILLIFDAIGPNLPPHPLTFRRRRHQLSPVQWDPSEWGRAGPPVLRRSRPKTVSVVILPPAAERPGLSEI